MTRKAPAVPATKDTSTRKAVERDDGSAKPLIPFSPKQWRDTLGLIATGTRVENAITKTKITRHALEGALRGDPKFLEQWNEAKMTAYRRNWDMDTIQEILVDVAMGMTVKQAVHEERGLDLPGFYKLLLGDPIVKEMYHEARQIQVEKMADDILEISDNADNDETLEGKPNSAAVNRSRLMADNRKWLMSKLNHKRFGDRLDQHVTAEVTVNHADTLTKARRRKEKLLNGNSK